MTVSLDWLTNVNVIINTTVVQAPTFNNCMIMGVFPTASRPSGSGGGFVTNWGTNLYYPYTNSADVTADFTVLYTAAITAEQWAQAFKYQILIKAAQEFFAQTPKPEVLYVGCIDNTAGGAIDYVAKINAIIAQNNTWYAFYIADQITASMLTTSGTGIYAALSTLVGTDNYKVLFVDTSNMSTASDQFLYLASNPGNQRAMLFAHTLNPQTAVPSAAVADPTVCLGAAAMGAYFTTVFTAGVGLKPMAGQTLQETTTDTAIDTSAIGQINPRSGLMLVNANVYPAFGNSTTGYMQYGFMSSATNDALVYLDQVVGADYIKLNVQADLTTYLLSQQPTGGVPYNDAGIQGLVTTFKNTLQNAVTQNIIQQFNNSNIRYVNAAQVSPTNKTNRVYNDLSASLVYLSRIQTLALTVTLNLV